MVNYNLAEFKTWLEADPQRKEVLKSWTYDLPTVFSYFVKGSNLDNPYFSPCAKLYQQWKAEVDERERERERKEQYGKYL